MPNINLKKIVDVTIVAALFIFPITFLNIRHGIHFSLYILLILLLAKNLFQLTSINKPVFLSALSLSSIFIAVGLHQILTGFHDLSAFDGPSRLLIAGLILIMLCNIKLKWSPYQLISISIPIGLLATYINLLINDQWRWDARWANYFVDPNSLGSQAGILAGLCIVSVSEFNKKLLLNLLKLIGALSGLAITVKAQSRGGFVAVLIILICWLLIRYVFEFRKKNSNENLKFFLLASFLIFAMGYLAYLTPEVNARTSLAFTEIKKWLHDPSIETSVGSRLSMWVVSLHIIVENPLGLGEVFIKQFMATHPSLEGPHKYGAYIIFTNGPHSDILSKGLSLGITGIIAYFFLIMTPMYLCIKSINNRSKEIAEPAIFGLVYTIAVFFTGLFNEMLSLKYLCSFYGLMIASILSTILGQTNEQR